MSNANSGRTTTGTSVCPRAAGNGCPSDRSKASSGRTCTGAGSVCPYLWLGVMRLPHVHGRLGDAPAVTEQAERVLPGSIKHDVFQRDRQADRLGRVLAQVHAARGRAAQHAFRTVIENSQLDANLVYSPAIREQGEQGHLLADAR